jgi:ubiquinone/menaquinone biosynthesis C-methylase UbiE
MFTVTADAYDRFMGRYSAPLAPRLCDFAGVEVGQRVLDVGCGPGALTAELARRVGSSAVAAVDPSEPFVLAARKRHPDVDVRLGAAEQLPLGDSEFDVSLAQLVVHFMSDPVAGLREMGRVTIRGGIVAACVWDHAGGEGPLSHFWAAARELDPDVVDESLLPGARHGHLAQLLHDAGMNEVEDTALTVSVEHASFQEWWEPFTLGVGPAGVYLAQLGPEGQARLRERCRELLAGELTITARAWAARGRVERAGMRPALGS